MKNLSKFTILFLAILIILLFIFGSIGYYQQFEDSQVALPIIFFEVIRLLLLGDTIFVLPCWQLLVARYIVVVIALYLFSYFFRNFLYRVWVIFRIRFFFKQHTVIFGLGKIGYRIASQLVKSGKKVVALEKDINNDNILKLRRLGGDVIIGSAFERNDLINIGIKAAANCLIVTGNDENNLHIADLLLYLNKEQVIKQDFKAFIHIDDWHNNNFLRNYLDLYNKTKNFTINTFNVNMATAQLLFDEYPPLKYVDFNCPEITNAIAVIGYNQAAELFIVENIILSHGPGLKNLKIYVIERNVNEYIDDFKFKYPFYSDFIDIIPIELDNENFYGNTFTSPDFLEVLKEIRVVYLFGQNDAYIIGIATSFRQLLYSELKDQKQIPIVVCLPEQTNVLDLIQPKENNNKLSDVPLFRTLSEHFNINIVRATSDTCTKAKLIDKTDSVDAMAKVVNYFYAMKYEFVWLLDEQSRQIIEANKLLTKLEEVFLTIKFTTDNPLYELETSLMQEIAAVTQTPVNQLRKILGIEVIWNNLADIKQDSNRYVVRHLPIKISFLSKTGQTELHKDSIIQHFKALAPIEHKRWEAEKLVYKFRFGPFPKADKKLKNLLKDTLRIHDQIIPYAQLSREMEDKDFNMFLLIPVLNDIKQRL